MSITAQEFEEGRQAFHSELIRRGAGVGPHYIDPNGYGPLWHDQFFGRDLTPTGTVSCKQALRVGATRNALDVAVTASALNNNDLIFPAGSTITLTLLQGDAEQGTFEDIGPTVCVKAPADGMTIAPGDTVCRFPIGDFQKPWLMVELEFSGAITGGTVDCSLGYFPR
ncbi:MAG: hypothetical protein NC489_46105 [Ruminococcus flavefaciens]|nr:hypothetical protein [Ruminococcus flavefaciens]